MERLGCERWRDVRLDGAAVLMTSVTGILLDKGARRPGAFGGLKLHFA